MSSQVAAMQTTQQYVFLYTVAWMMWIISVMRNRRVKTSAAGNDGE